MELSPEAAKAVQDASTAAVAAAAAAKAAAAAAEAATKVVQQVCGSPTESGAALPRSRARSVSSDEGVSRQQYLREKVDPVFAPMLRLLVNEKPDDVRAFVASQLGVDPLASAVPKEQPDIVLVPSFTAELGLLKRENARLKNEVKVLVKQVHEARDNAEQEETNLHLQNKALRRSAAEGTVDAEANAVDEGMGTKGVSGDSLAKVEPLLPKKRSLIFLHMNDVYMYEAGKMEPVGGAARMATLCKTFADQHPIIVHSGDFLSPSTTSNMTHGEHMVEIMNLIGVEYGCLGNHDFDFGLEVTKQMLALSSATWLLSNIVDPVTKKPLCGAHESVLVNHAGVAVGFMGVCEDWLSMCSKLKVGDDCEYLDIFETAIRLEKELRERGAEVVIAITHSRNDIDCELADRVPGLDLILGGHDHGYALYESARTGVPMVKSGTDFRDLTSVKITVAGDGADATVKVAWPPGRIPVNSSIEEDAAVNETVSYFHDVVAQRMKKPIGSCTVDLDARVINVRRNESAVGNLIADVYRATYGADVAIINGGSIRSDSVIAAGELSMDDVMTLFPFEDTCAFIEITGDQLFEALENGVSRTPAQDGRFAHYSGVTFSFNHSLEKGSKVDPGSVLVNGAPFDRSASFKVATNSFLAAGREGYKMFGEGKTKELIAEEYGITVHQALTDYLKRNSPLSPKLEGRIVDINTADGEGS